MTIEEMVEQEMRRNRALAEFNKEIAREIWGGNR